MTAARTTLSLANASYAQLFSFFANKNFITETEMLCAERRVEELSETESNLAEKTAALNLQFFIDERLNEKKQVEKWQRERPRRQRLITAGIKTSDGYMALPLEIQANILEFLSFYERTDLFSVSKDFARAILASKIDNIYLYQPKLNAWMRIRKAQENSINFLNLYELEIFTNPTLQDDAIEQLLNQEAFQPISVFGLIMAGSDIFCFRDFPLIAIYLITFLIAGGIGIGIGARCWLSGCYNFEKTMGYIFDGGSVLLGAAAINEMIKQKANNVYRVSSVGRWASRLFSQPNTELFYTTIPLSGVTVEGGEEAEKKPEQEQESILRNRNKAGKF